MAEGLRERKKRQTRQYISDVATGMFMERGFEAVTIAEIAEAAEVSVNTVYNYFPTKEDLFVDREEEIIDRPSRLVRERRAGQSAAQALLEQLRRDIRERQPYVGLSEGYERFRQVMVDSPTLMARLFTIQGKTVSHLGVTLREEAAAAPEDPTPSSSPTNWSAFRTPFSGASCALSRRAVAWTRSPRTPSGKSTSWSRSSAIRSSTMRRRTHRDAPY